MKTIVKIVLMVFLQCSSLFSTAAYQAEHLWTAALLVQHGLDLKAAQFSDAHDTGNYEIALAKSAALDGVSTLSQFTSLTGPEYTVIRNTLNELEVIYSTLIVTKEKVATKDLPQLIALQTVFQSAYDTLTALYNENQTEWLGILLSYVQNDLLIIAKAVHETSQLNYRQQYLTVQN